LTFLVPIAMFGMPLIGIYLFQRFSPEKATTIAVVVGTILLPVAEYELPGLPTYTKSFSISLGLLLGGMISGKSAANRLRVKAIDIPMIAWCFISPLATSISNGLGLYDGISGLAGNVLYSGIFYWAGRKYFSDPASLRTLTLGILTGGIIYIPLVFFEVRMSPQLSNIIYGFFPNSFAQGYRYGGFRPIIFMDHFLMVSLFMAFVTTISFWLWRIGDIKRIWKIPVPLISVLLIVSTILCKSANGWVYLALGLIGTIFYSKTRSTMLIRILLLIVPLYIALRISNIFSIEQILDYAGRIFDPERINSLTWRLRQEDLFGEKALLRIWFGWGGYNRGWPIDPYTGMYTIRMVDSLWVIIFSKYGLFGLATRFPAVGLGAWMVQKNLSRKRLQDFADRGTYAIDAVVLSFALCFVLLDSLVNSMWTPIYMLCSGVLMNYAEYTKIATAPAIANSLE
jgi:hypothetical protein